MNARTPREAVRVRERGSEAAQSAYETCISSTNAQREHAKLGKVVVRPEDREWEHARQGKLLFYLLPEVFPDTALTDWWVFTQEIHSHSGKHRHQGGLVIYILEGEGYTVIDGERVDWKAGDLLLLPPKPGGIEHQHFNVDPNKPSFWLAFIYRPFWNEVASEMVQREVSPLYQAMGAAS